MRYKLGGRQPSGFSWLQAQPSAVTGLQAPVSHNESDAEADFGHRVIVL